MKHRLPPVVQLMRPHQWVKNLLVFAPLFFTPEVMNFANFAVMFAGFMSFCAVASSIYIYNDACDIEADRAHPEKKYRPLAAGTVSLKKAYTAMAGLLAAAVIIGFLIGGLEWLGLMALYGGVNVAYSFKLKHVSLLDVLIVAAGFVLRIIAGAVLLNLEASAWIIICTFFGALFIAFGKRRDDLIRLDDDSPKRKSLDGYNLAYVDSAMMVLAAMSIMAYTLYTLDPAVQSHFQAPLLFWTVPFVAMGFLRYLQICLVENRGGAPTRIILKDKFLRLVFIGWFGLFAGMIYS